MVKDKLVILASLAFLTSSPLSADGLHSSLSFPQCTDHGLSSNYSDIDALEYEVLRKNKKIGTHRIWFDETDTGTKVTTRTEMKVKLLFVTVFKYEYVSEELWCGNKLLKVETRVNDNGTRINTLAVNNDERFVAELNGKSYELPADFYTTNHWNAGVVKTDKVFNTITGKINAVSYQPTGEAILQTKLGEKAVTQFAVDGELAINSFYDHAGNWSGMAFEHEDGSLIEFRCLKCGLPDQKTASASAAAS